MNFLISTALNTENAIRISVYDVVGDELFMTMDDGQKVYDLITAAFRENKNAIVSFKGVEETTPGALDAAITQLYEHFSEEQIESSLSIVDIHPDDAEDIGYGIQWKKEYLEDPQRYINAVRETFGDDYL
ncbi:STAS-like domain-containing protein [Trichocoleus sp. FACHB-90]|uniref:STAS-like domain-containing protein n=1 Tax=Cyanophyceae TaxID=3028117 RepID=UPI00168474DD|nr:STAS-like domain-containing protein [Trichocoleus sp. FACHB-90]MBD1927953.1 STAS-like domain-containing protein [Trichocoleus sp. FACHB-90]